MVTKGTKEIPSTAQTKQVSQEPSPSGKRSPKKTHVTTVHHSLEDEA